MLAIGRAWGHGRHLYSDLFIDRPQLLLATYRFVEALTGASTFAVRAMAAVFGALAVVSCAEIARRLVSPSAGIAAALIVAVTSSAPAIDGFAANGELLSGSLSSAAIAAAAMVITGRLRDRWLVGAGVLAGCALAMKQSGFDGAVTVAAWLALTVVLGIGGRRRAFLRLLAFVTGVATVAGAIMVHAALTGWGDWWYAIYTHPLETRDVRLSWPRFFRTWDDARPILIPVVIAGVAAGLIGVAQRRSASTWSFRIEVTILPIWLVVATASFVSGGQFYHHYWLILTLPLATLVGAIVGSLRARIVVVALTVGAVLPALWSTAGFLTLPRSEIPLAIDAGESSSREEEIVQWFRDSRREEDSLYVLCSAPSIYALAHVDPPFPTLWFYATNYVRGAQENLRTMLSSDGRPTFVIEMQQPASCGLRGNDEDLLIDYYDEFTTIRGKTIYIRADDDRAATAAG
ncbi:MAG: glycosyltransferase family 39 protein [Ilumatobacteraceae bacterium]